MRPSRKVTLISIFGYAAALILIALSATSVLLLSSRALELQKTNAAQINLSGRQRMLTQRIVRASEGYLINSFPEDQIRETIINCSNLMVRSHHAIISNNPSQIQSLIDEGVECQTYSNVQTAGFSDIAADELLFMRELDQVLRVFTNIATDLTEKQTSIDVFQSVLSIREVGDSQLLRLFDESTLRLQRLGQERVDAIGRAETYAWMITIALILFEAIFIFYPLIRVNKRALVEAERRAYEAEQSALYNENLRRSLDNARSFFANMSHELRTPINAISGFSEAYINVPKLQGQNGERAISYFKNISEAAGNLRNLVDDLLDFAVIESGKFDLEIETIELRDCVMRAVKQLRGLQDNFNAKVVIDPQRLEVLGDRQATHQVLLNVISNAIKYSAENSTVYVTVDQSDSGGEARLSIIDRGIGMEAGEIEQAYEPFFRLNNPLLARDGTGLGLPIAKQLMQLQRGDIDIQSTPREGTKVTLSFPTRPAEA